MGVSIKTDYNDKTKLSEWYKIIRQNEIALKEGIEHNHDTKLENSDGAVKTQNIDRGAVTAEKLNKDVADTLHTHNNKNLLDGFNDDRTVGWDNASRRAHEHENKQILDEITGIRIQNWDNAAGGGAVILPKSVIYDMLNDDLAERADMAHTHDNSTKLDMITYDLILHPEKRNNPHGVDAEQVGLGNVDNESKAEMFDSPVFTGTPQAPTAAAGTATKQIATTEFVRNEFENSFKGFSSGMIVMWFGTANNIPSGWVLCDGSNGTPDLRDKFIVGACGEYAVGETGGAKEVTLTLNQIPNHSHSIDAGSANSYGGYAAYGSGSGSIKTDGVGGGQAHENLPPYYALCFIMKI